MMHRLRIEKVSRGWEISLREEGVGAPRSSLGVAASLGRRKLLAWRRQLIDAGESDAWCAEFPKAGIGEGELALGYAELAATACAGQESGSFEYVAPRAWFSKRSLYLAFRRRGMQVAKPPLFAESMDRLSFLAAGVLAWCALAVAAIWRVPVERKPSGRGWLLAVHGEWSNRTRHVLPEAAGSRPPMAILVVGRIRKSLRDIGQEWKRELGGRQLPPIMAPWSAGSLVAAIPIAWSLTRDAMRLAATAPYLPSFQQRVAMLYRAYLGVASAEWWRRQALPPTTIAYGHTGNADTTLLELAQQASGHATCHVVHGISAGLNFVGRSSIAIFRCGHDAKWHEHLGGYGESRYLPAELPTVRVGGEGLLLLTNYAHPMNLEYRACGVRPECDVLADISSAWSRSGAKAGVKHWRPHPAMAILPEAERDEVRAAAEIAGFIELPARADWTVAASDAHLVVVTASTVAIQLLEMGVPPLVLIPESLDPDSALAQYPLSARNPVELLGLLESMESGVNGSVHLMSIAWEAVSPGRRANVGDWME